MRVFNEWPEKTLHWARWFLVLSWGLLIASLLAPLPWPPQWSGNRVFWGMVVPSGLLLIVVSHELWRRICPLAYACSLSNDRGTTRLCDALFLDQMVH